MTPRDRLQRLLFEHRTAHDPASSEREILAMFEEEQELEQLRAELAHYKQAATKLSAETYDLEAELMDSREREARMRGH